MEGGLEGRLARLRPLALFRSVRAFESSYHIRSETSVSNLLGDGLSV